MDGIKKTALFLSGLEWQTVDLLLGRLEPDQARALRREMLSLENIPLREADRLATEFLRAAGGSRNRNTVIEHQLSAPAAYGPPHHKNSTQNSTQYSTPRFSESDWQSRHFVEKKSKPFEFFRNIDTEEIVREISSEHPQTVAVVLAHLPASQARTVLNELPDSLQREVTRRLADFDVPDEDVLRDIETSIREQFEERLREKQRRAAVRQVLGIEK